MTGDFETIVDLLARREPEDYADRAGFDPMFLGRRVEMPKPSARIDGAVARLNGSEETELRYAHFSVLMNRERRLAFVSAGNLRIDAPFAAARREPWGFDPRLDAAAQAGAEFYARNDLDRGHLFRRADGAWGETAAEAAEANDDTFHWTNIAPQHFIFNQSGQDPERSLWGLLEGHVVAEAERGHRRINVFNGPIFEPDDPVHRGLRVPRAYWKVLSVVEAGGRLRAYAFVLGQEGLLSDLPRAAFDPGRFALFQLTTSALGARVGLDFGELEEADALAVGTGARSAAGVARIRRLADVSRG